MSAAYASLVGRTCVITGATSGIGRATAAGLAKLGAERIVLVARNAKLAAEVSKEVSSLCAETKVETVLADLSALSEVRRAAGDILRSAPSIDVLINNAGLFLETRTLSADGYEAMFAVNHLAPFLFTTLLVDGLCASGAGRIVTVASFAYRWGKINFDDLQSERRFRPMEAYNQSKLANILFTRELARKLEGKSVTANCLSPGMVRTPLNPKAGLLGFATKLASGFLKTPEQGSETTVFLASVPGVTGISGQYFSNCKIKTLARRATDDATAARLWDVSADLTSVHNEAD